MGLAAAGAWGRATGSDALAAVVVRVGVAGMALFDVAHVGRVGGAAVPKGKTLDLKQVRGLVAREYELDPALREEVRAAREQRPTCRAQCVDGPRPCPWLSCAHHLALDVTEAGGLKVNFPGRDLEELPETCALDVADRGGVTLEEVGRVLHLVRERVRQIEERLLEQLRGEVKTSWTMWR